MLFKNISYLDEYGNIQSNGYVRVENRNITYVGKDAPVQQQEEVFDGYGKLLMPGFVNSHSHTPMTLMRGYGEGMVLSKWLNECIFPFEARLLQEDIYHATLLGIANSKPAV